MQPTARQVRSKDGATSELRFVRAPASRAAVLVMPALGAPASYYDPFALGLAERGFTVIVGENRGTGTSSVRARRGVDYGYAEVLRDDWSVILEQARSIAGTDVCLVGHSIGGQLGCLYEAEHPGAFRALVLATACSVEWRAWPAPRRYTFFGQVLAVGAISRILGHFPGDRVGFGGQQGARMMGDWTRQALTGRYAPEGTRFDYERALSEVTTQVLSVAVRGDGYAPRSACDGLLAKMPRATVERADIDAKWTLRRPNDAHFRWAREPSAMLDAIEAFLCSSSASSAP